MTLDLIRPHEHDLGTFTVRRTLPAQTHRLIGPFIFFDHMGPAELPPGVGMDVRPHPHIGLATVTYLFEGSALHRDSLGNVQSIVPGDINWMMAGRGIVHSERSTPEALRGVQRLHGIQTWVALPRVLEDAAPQFSHHGAETLPEINLPGCVVRLLLGRAWGRTSPVEVPAPIVYAHLRLRAGTSIGLDVAATERAIYAVDAPLRLDGLEVPTQNMAVLSEHSVPILSCDSDCTVMLLGGAAIDGARFINWNFVASSRERIDAARQSWTTYPNEQFPQVPDETDFIPLPLPRP